MRWNRRIDFAGRSVAITGGSRGLGLLLAHEFAREGARVALVARSLADLERARDQIEGHTGNPPLIIAADVTQRDAVREALEQVRARQGSADVLVNNAGRIDVGPVESMGDEDFEKALAVHFWAPLFAIEAVLPAMRRRRRGRIVNISSIGGRVAVPHLLPYTASKHALTGLSDALSAELSREGIRVTTVAPGLMRTGSHWNASLRGQAEAEFAWFAIADSLPGLSMDARRAARKIIDACRFGDRRCTLGVPAKLAIVANAVAPELFAELMAVANLVLPKAGPKGRDEPRSGWDSRSWLAPSWLTRLADRAAVQNNELAGHAATDLFGDSAGEPKLV